MNDITSKKTKLEQKKARLVMEEVRFKMQERKQRTRHFIELGGLIVKAELDLLPSNTLYGALLSLNDLRRNNKSIIDTWTKVGSSAFDTEEKDKLPIVLTLAIKPEQSLKDKIRQHGLRWNQVRQEWYGYVTDMVHLKEILKDTAHNIEIMQK